MEIGNADLPELEVVGEWREKMQQEIERSLASPAPAPILGKKRRKLLTEVSSRQKSNYKEEVREFIRQQFNTKDETEVDSFLINALRPNCHIPPKKTVFDTLENNETLLKKIDSLRRRRSHYSLEQKKSIVILFQEVRDHLTQHLTEAGMKPSQSYTAFIRLIKSRRSDYCTLTKKMLQNWEKASNRQKSRNF